MAKERDPRGDTLRLVSLVGQRMERDTRYAEAVNALAKQTERANRAEAERDALRGAVEAVREWERRVHARLEARLGERDRKAWPWAAGVLDASERAVKLIDEALAAARIEAGLGTSRERP